MQVYVERGVSKGDCLQKIVDKYGIRFTILREKTFRRSGFLGLFPREGVELEFCLSPQRGLGWPSPVGIALPGSADAYSLPAEQLLLQQYAGKPAATPAAVPKDDSTLNFVEEKKRVLAAAGKDPERLIRETQGQEEK